MKLETIGTAPASVEPVFPRRVQGHLYMAGSAFGFETGRLNLAQVLFARPDRDGHVTVPRTRADLYRPAEHPGGGAAREA